MHGKRKNAKSPPVKPQGKKYRILANSAPKNPQPALAHKGNKEADKDVTNPKASLSRDQRRAKDKAPFWGPSHLRALRTPH